MIDGMTNIEERIKSFCHQISVSGAIDAEIQAELCDHLREKVAEYLKEGMSEDEALERAFLEFGDTNQIGSLMRSAHSSVWIATKLAKVLYCCVAIYISLLGPIDINWKVILTFAFAPATKVYLGIPAIIIYSIFHFSIVVVVYLVYSQILPFFGKEIGKANPKSSFRKSIKLFLLKLIRMASPFENIPISSNALKVKFIAYLRLIFWTYFGLGPIFSSDKQQLTLLSKVPTANSITGFFSTTIFLMEGALLMVVFSYFTCWMLTINENTPSIRKALVLSLIPLLYIAAVDPWAIYALPIYLVACLGGGYLFSKSAHKTSVFGDYAHA